MKILKIDMEILILNTSTQIKTLLIKADLSVNENT
jgi:hypothetical protein